MSSIQVRPFSLEIVGFRELTRTNVRWRRTSRRAP